MSAFFIGNEQIAKLAYASGLPAKKLYDLNVEALRQRYPGDYNEMIQPFIEIPNLVYESDEQKYQSISCFLYQCSEGKVPSKKIYKDVEKFQNIVARAIADRRVSSVNPRWE